jgi:Na+-driven multidrug efflux pump
MSKQTKAFIYNLLGFAVFFFPLRYLVATYTNLEGLWIPVTALVMGTILAPKFQSVRTREGEKLFMKWIFTKGVKEVK